jgi:hypothetical protein
MRRAVFALLLAGVLGYGGAEAAPRLFAGLHGIEHGILDFGHAPSRTSAASGSWSSPATWSGGRVPDASDVVRIAPGHTVILDAPDAAAKVVGVSGTLRFQTDTSTRLTVETVLVYPEGTLEIGTTAKPVQRGVRAEIVFAGAVDTASDPEQFGLGLLGFGTIRMHGAIKTPWRRLSVEPLKGHTSFTFAEAPSGWEPGDRLVLPDTRQLTHAEAKEFKPQWELPVIAAAFAGGAEVPLDAPLAWDHWGARATLTKELEYLPHAGNLTRNVVLRSASAATPNRGHTLFSQRADVDMRYVEFRQMGRTTNEPLDSTTRDGGRVTHVGTNQIGRYPVHMHHLDGPSGRQAGEQWVLDGLSVVDSSKWPIAIHASHFGRVSDSVLFGGTGSGITTEDGSETGNLIARNFVVGIRGIGGTESMGREGSGFWFRGPFNRIKGNVAASCPEDYGYKWFLMRVGESGDGKVRVPTAPGQDHGRHVTRNANASALLEVDGNEVYGAMSSGLTYWWIGAMNTSPILATPESIIRNTVVWHVYDRGVFHYPSYNVTIDGFVMRSRNTETAACCALGIDFGDYYGRKITLRNLDIQGRGSAISGSVLADSGTGDPFIVENAHFVSQVGMHWPLAWNVAADATILKPRRAIIRNLTYEYASAGYPGLQNLAIHMDWSHGDGATIGATILDEVRVFRFQGNPDDNFRLYYNPQQLASYGPVPQSAKNVLGCPSAGMTNQQCWAAHGVAIAGGIAACETTRPGIGGLACPLKGEAPAPRPPATVSVSNDR